MAVEVEISRFEKTDYESPWEEAVKAASRILSEDRTIDGVRMRYSVRKDGSDWTLNVYLDMDD